MLTFLNQVFKPVFAQGSDFFGEITPPPGVDRYPSGPGGLIVFLNNIIKLMIVGAGLFALFNFVTAGYGFISASGDSQKINQAWAKIWQSLIGLLIATGSFVLAAVFGKLIFGDWGAIVNPKIYGPPTN